MAHVLRKAVAHSLCLPASLTHAANETSLHGHTSPKSFLFYGFSKIGFMSMEKQYKSDAFAAIHEMMEDLHEIGAIDKQTMRKFDEACLAPKHEMSAKTIKELRLRKNIS